VKRAIEVTFEIVGSSSCSAWEKRWKHYWQAEGVGVIVFRKVRKCQWKTGTFVCGKLYPTY